MDIEKVKKLNIPKSPGCYQFLDKTGKILYIGKAANLKSRVSSYFLKGTSHSSAKHSMLKKIVKIKLIETDSEIEALLLESNLIKKHQPPYNVVMRDDKRYQYIKITTDDIPRITTTRNIDKSGRYFGPFTSGTAVRETLKAIGKIFPYGKFATMPKNRTNETKIKRYPEIYQAPENSLEYKKIIKQITSFLEGDRKSVERNLKLEIRNLGKSLLSFPRKRESSSSATNNIPGSPIGVGDDMGDKITHSSFCHSEGVKTTEESRYLTPPLKLRRHAVANAQEKVNCEAREAALGYDKREEIENKISALKYRLLNMKNVLAHANVLSIYDKYASDVVELAKTLGLTRVPKRIEGYDISNIFGKEAVGSMVVFKNGDADKSQYRKFKIKNVKGANDTAMLKEILERRFNNAPDFKKDGTGWPLPDLIIIDGGKGQLNAGLQILKKFKLNIPIIAISKGEGLRSAKAPDKIFFPGEKEALKLPLASPALHIIKRVRDEAHRFAITFHRQKRSKNFKK